MRRGELAALIVDVLAECTRFDALLEGERDRLPFVRGWRGPAEQMARALLPLIRCPLPPDHAAFSEPGFDLAREAVDQVRAEIDQVLRDRPPQDRN